MNFQSLLYNLRETFALCSTWRDRWQRLLWLYGNNSLIKKITSSQYQIQFNLAKPVNKVNLLVRNNRGSDNFIFSEVFTHQYYRFDLPNEPSTILDLGANTGFTTIFFSRRYPHAEIASVEPISSNIDLLRKNLALNQVKSCVFPAAISVVDGTVQMEIAPRDYGHKVANIQYGASFGGEIIDVEAISIPTLMKRMNWEKIDLLKIDIEGYEAILLKDSCDWLNQVNNICIECHEGYGESDLFAMAKQWGFLPPQQLPGTWLLTRVCVS